MKKSSHQTIRAIFQKSGPIRVARQVVIAAQLLGASLAIADDTTLESKTGESKTGEPKTAEPQVTTPQPTPPSDAAAAANDQSAPTFTYEIMPPGAHIAEPLTWVVTIEHRPGEVVLWPETLDVHPFELLAPIKSSSQTLGALIRERYEFTLTTYEVGALKIPAIAVQIGGKTYSTAAQDYTVAETLGAVDVTGPAPPARQGDGAPLSVEEPIYWPLIAAAALFLAVAALWMLRRLLTEKGAQRTEEEVLLPAHEVALTALKALKAGDTLTTGDFRSFYFEASEIIRTYLQRRYQVNALDLTTYELMRALEGVVAPGMDRDGLKRWLSHADFVKFAKFKPSPEQALSMVDFFEKLIWNTYAAPTVQPESRHEKQT